MSHVQRLVPGTNRALACNFRLGQGPNAGGLVPCSLELLDGNFLQNCTWCSGGKLLTKVDQFHICSLHADRKDGEAVVEGGIEE